MVMVLYIPPERLSRLKEQSESSTRSPDLTSLDFYLFIYLKSKVKYTGLCNPVLADLFQNGPITAESSIISNRNIDIFLYKFFVVIWCRTLGRDVSKSGVVTSSISFLDGTPCMFFKIVKDVVITNETVSQSNSYY